MVIMKRKNYINLNSIRSIKKVLPRFLSLMIMSMLGVFTFSGLQATSPDMLNTIDKYLDVANTYDIKIVSTMGLVNNDIEKIKEIDGIKEVEGSYSKDIIIKNAENEIVINVASMPNSINQLKLIEGRLPVSKDEIVVEANMLTKNNLKIGDTLNLDDDVFYNKNVKIVGTVDSSLYFNNTKMQQNRGNTNIGAGKIDYYTYIPSENFNQDYYSAIYLTVTGALDKKTSSEQYTDLISKVSNKLEDIKLTQEKARYDSLYKELEEKINKNEKDANKELADAKKELDNAKKELNNGKKELNNASTQLKNFKKQLDNAKVKLDNTKKQLNDTKLELENSKNYITEIEYNYGIKQYNQGMLQYQKGLKEYNTNLAKYNKSEKEYNKNLKTYETNLKKYEDGLKEYNKNKKELEQKINNAREELKEIEEPTWYIYDRTDYSTYSDYIDDTNSITNLSKLFPTVFFAVAILISLISMNRMVEEDRLEIGTLKSLGFSNNTIMSKYLLFSFLATILGGIIGSTLGLTIIPLIIFNIYGLLFDIPNFQYTLNLGTTILSFAIIILCVCGTTVITVRKVLLEKPSDLMRPKAPKSGKRVFLEKIKVIWNHINFSKKITIRNLFRYKKRVMATVIGIAGCTALMLCGFGIRDAIVDIVDMQYNNIYKFDASIYTKNLKKKNIAEVFDNKNITKLAQSQTISGKLKDIDVNMFITENNEVLSDVVNLIDVKTKEIDKLETGKVIITDKLADLLGYKVGDTIEILGANNKSYKYEISAIVKNYLGHFIYMDKDTFEMSEEKYEPNLIYINTDSVELEEQNEIKSQLLEKDEIINVSFKSSLMESADNMLKSLNKVVAILILLAAMLAFVVLYNLSNINITERKREISTLKVLGFYDNEVDNYITKETVILTIIGIVFGLVAGFYLTKTVISTLEIDKARFIYNIKPISYLLATALSVIFTFVVNIITHFHLKKIDMIESLKSIE